MPRLALDRMIPTLVLLALEFIGIGVRLSGVLVLVALPFRARGDATKDQSQRPKMKSEEDWPWICGSVA